MVESSQGRSLSRTALSQAERCPPHGWVESKRSTVGDSAQYNLHSAESQNFSLWLCKIKNFTIKQKANSYFTRKCGVKGYKKTDRARSWTECSHRKVRIHKSFQNTFLMNMKDSLNIGNKLTLSSSICTGPVGLTLVHAAKCPKGLSCFEKQTAKHFLKWKDSKI